MTYLAPLKLAVVDEEGTMRLHYWPKNDLMKGPPIPLAQLKLDTPPSVAAAAAAARAGRAEMVELRLDNRNGTVLEGVMPGCAASAIDFFTDGYYPAYELSVDSQLVFTISLLSPGEHPYPSAPKRTVLDTFDRSIAKPASGDCDFKLLLRGSMVELYVNTVLTLPFALPNTVSPGGYNKTGDEWASGVRAPTINIGLSGAWATCKSSPCELPSHA